MMSINDSDLILPKPNLKSQEVPLLEPKSVSYRSNSMRWLALALACLNCLGSYFCLDNPQALQTIIIEHFKISSFQFNLLYSVYGLPNIILPLLGGLIIDRLGVRVGVTLFPFILILGQLVCTFGAAFDNFNWMLVGRVIFGFGGETLNVAQSAIITKWFLGKELAFALGASLCIARLGSSFNSFFSPKIYDWTGELYSPLLVGAILCVFSFVIGIGLAYVDKKADEQEGITDSTQESGEQISWKDVKKLNLLFYLLLFNGFFLYGGFYGLNNNLNDLMVQRFGFSPSSAGNFIPIIYICAAVLIPLFGIYIDNHGKRALLMLASCIIFVIDHLAIAFLPDSEAGSPNYGMVVILFGVGLFYATYAAIYWPCIPLVVEEKVTGTAFGIVICLQNLMLTIIPLIMGGIHDATEEFHQGYFWTEICLAGLAVAGILLTIWIYFVDIKTGKRLENAITESKKTSVKKSIAKSKSFARM